jgi:hypothetical protein
MNNEQFNKILERRLIKIKEILGSKADEYSMNSDRLWNFKQAAPLVEGSSAQALWGMLAKHLVSVQDLVMKRLVNSRPNCDEKIGDAINYLILLEAVLREEREHIKPNINKINNES